MALRPGRIKKYIREIKSIASAEANLAKLNKGVRSLNLKAISVDMYCCVLLATCLS